RGAHLLGIRLRVGIVGHRRAFDCDGGGPAGLPVQGDDSGRRGLGDASGRRRDRALHRLSQDRRMAEPPQGCRGDRRRRRAARAQRARGRRNAKERDRTGAENRRNRAPAWYGGSPPDRSAPALGLTMLVLIVVVIMMGFPTAFTLMGLGMFFGYIAFYEPHQ